MALSQTQITDLPTLSYTSESKIPILSYTLRLKKISLSGYYGGYPPGLCLEVESCVVKKGGKKPLGYAKKATN